MKKKLLLFAVCLSLIVPSAASAFELRKDPKPMFDSRHFILLSGATLVTIAMVSLGEHRDNTSIACGVTTMFTGGFIMSLTVYRF